MKEAQDLVPPSQIDPTPWDSQERVSPAQFKIPRNTVRTNTLGESYL